LNVSCSWALKLSVDSYVVAARRPPTRTGAPCRNGRPTAASGAAGSPRLVRLLSNLDRKPAKYKMLYCRFPVAGRRHAVALPRSCFVPPVFGCGWLGVVLLTASELPGLWAGLLVSAVFRRQRARTFRYRSFAGRIPLACSPLAGSGRSKEQHPT